MVQLYVSHLRRALDGNGARILTRGRGYELVSERVGNVQNHLQGFTLLDQLWVR